MDKDLDKTLEDFITDEKNSETKIKSDKSLVEVINKKIIVEDGRQLLI